MDYRRNHVYLGRVFLNEIRNLMSHFKIFVYCVLAFISLVNLGCSREHVHKKKHLVVRENPAWQSVVSYATEHLPLEGKLVGKSDGFVYLKVDDDYIRRLFPMLGLKEDGFRVPPYFRRIDSPGAHISVFYADEHITPEELGKTFHFIPKKIVVLQLSKNTSYAVLQVESPELEKLREKYGATPKLFGHDFHISLARKKAHLHYK
ncbi:hypothetical protein DB43_GS00100 [Parachlamydia acanthamoebae]|nr:hypothetical protein DB43_GS00100 [Parachlamydia acanthamoebae]